MAGTVVQAASVRASSARMAGAQSTPAAFRRPTTAPRLHVRPPREQGFNARPMGSEASPFRPGLFSGRVALITDGGTGIGLAIAEELTSLAASVALCGRRVEPVTLAAEGLLAMIPQRGGRIINVIANIARGFPGMAHTGAARRRRRAGGQGAARRRGRHGYTATGARPRWAMKLLQRLPLPPRRPLRDEPAADATGGGDP